jgi:hypothetical protein
MQRVWTPLALIRPGASNVASCALGLERREGASGQQADAQKNQVERNTKTSDLIPWSIQEIRSIAQRLARKRIQPADVIAWSLWRRAHQAAAQKSHLKQKLQL